MKYILIFWSLMMSFSLSAAAATEAERAAEAQSGETMTSANNRRGKNLRLLADVGFSIPSIPSTGLSVGKYFSRNKLLELSYAAGLSQTNEAKEVMNSITSGSVVLLRYANFLDDSFYITGGTGYLSQKIFKSSISSKSPGSTAQDYKVNSAAIVLTGAFGNMWQLEGLTIGADWLGAYIPVKQTTFKSNRESSIERNSTDAKAEEKLLKSVQFAIARFYVGVSF